MKYFFAAALALILFINLIDIVPQTQAPAPENKNYLPASIVTDNNENQTEILNHNNYNSPETKAHLQLLDIYVEEKRDLPAAQTIIDKTSRTETNKRILSLYEAKIQARMLNFEKAEMLLNEIDGNELALLKMAVLIASGDRNKSGTYIHDLIDNNPDPYIKSVALAFLNLYQEYDRNLDADESYLWTLFAQKLGELKEYELANYLSQKAVGKKPEYRDAWIIKGYTELSMKKYPEAEESLLGAYKLDPGNTQIQYLLGLTYFELNNPELSNQYLLYANKNDSKYRNIILEKLAENAIKTEDYPLGIFYYETLLGKDNTNKNALSRLIWIYTEKQNNPDSALKYALTLTQAYPQDSNSYHLLSWIHSQLGELDKAVEALEKANSLPKQ